MRVPGFGGTFPSTHDNVRYVKLKDGETERVPPLAIRHVQMIAHLPARVRRTVE